MPKLTTLKSQLKAMPPKRRCKTAIPLTKRKATILLTFEAEYAASCSDAEFMALVEHELYHAGQERDVFGARDRAGRYRPCVWNVSAQGGVVPYGVAITEKA